ncbi:MAG: hypothetical protein K2P25_07930 [Lachnospiraceae bacterium]|nr:hypothetical protein [Lachnospiraceae bacterium]
MFISKKRLQSIEKRITDLEKSQFQSKKVNLEEIRKAVRESFVKTGKNPFEI